MCMWLPGKGPPVCAVSGSQTHLLKPLLPVQVMALVIFHFTHSQENRRLMCICLQSFSEKA